MCSCCCLWFHARRHPETVLKDALRLLPDLLRVLRRLAADRTGSHQRAGETGPAAGLPSPPLDLVPDFLPVIGHADDVIIVALVLRSVSPAPAEPLRRHWPGTPEGLHLILTLAGLGAPRQEFRR